MNIFKFQLLNFMPVLFAGYNGESKQLPRSWKPIIPKNPSKPEAQCNIS
jgi:hypothetical protein